MVYNVVLSPRANREVEQILLYLDEHWYAEIIDRFMTDLANTLYRIQRYPFSFPGVEGDESARKAQLLPFYSVFYEVEADVIRILSVFDQRQNPDKLKSILSRD
ncbi:MAG TPA: type II toxin-antitoxin system RelE/ParE family toxin [Chitinophagales bacterium]|nr:type II toxin-antitoxin system RelE/ParE family toxin [Chitinophagales bacterium]